jgi:tRNA pseudouridine65 synthase
MKPVTAPPAPEILYLDDHLVVVHKPADLLVHRSPIDRRETRFALQLVRDLIGRRVYPVHRLDRPTSGALLFGLTPEAAHSLCQSFIDGEVAKTYLAVVRGVTAAKDIIDHPLSEEPDRIADPLAAADKKAQAAVTGFRRLAETEFPFALGRYPTSRYCLVEAHPRTGRRHQLRRHFKHIFHPIIGDTKYGEGRHNRLFRDEFDCRRLLLAAVELTFPHPASGRPLTVCAPLADSFTRIIDQFGWLEALPARWRR